MWFWDKAGGNLVKGSYKCVKNMLLALQVAFVPNTHYVFTVGKDRMLKYWDMDRWELLLDLPGHHAEVCLLSFPPWFLPQVPSLFAMSHQE